MMKHTTVHAFPKHYDNDNFEPVMLDLEAFENMLVIECGDDYTVLDRQENRLYSVKANSCIEAVKKYIDWVYGEMHIYEWDSVEGGYEMTSEKDWASTDYSFEIDRLDWEEVVES